MDGSEDILDRTEAQRPTDVSHEQRTEAQRPTDVSHKQRRRSCFPMDLIRFHNSRSAFQRGGEGTPSREIVSVPEFRNLTLLQFLEVSNASVPMTPETCSAVIEGNYKFSTQKDNPTRRQKDILHLAAAHGHLELVKSIVCESPSLFLKKNSNDQLPIHVAANAGCLAGVEVLAALLTSVSARLSEEERERLSEEDKERLNIYILKDKKGDTALHLALKGHHMKTAACLVKANQLWPGEAAKTASFLANKDGISPLYLAVEAGNVSLVYAMLNTTVNDGIEGRNSSLYSLVHAALKAKSTDILDLILEKDPTLVDKQYQDGKTCLSLGASIGFYKGVRNLLARSTKTVYVPDHDGSFPIHIAVEKGHMKVVAEILIRCPDSKHLLNKQGQNILHIASKSWRAAYGLLCYLSETGWRNQMMDKQDVDGNTPLHLATINWRPFVLMFLLYFNVKGKTMYIRNNKGLTPLDIAESNMQPNYIFTERLTLMVLLCFNAPVSRDSIWERLRKNTTKPSYPLAGDKNKEYINMLLVVAALVATVTFSAGLTIPGGFNSSAPNRGLATLAYEPKIVLFMVFDILAMQCSVLTIATLIWAQFGDPALLHRSLNMALPLLFFSLLCMSMAFYCAVFAAFAHVIVLVVFLSFTFVIFLILMLFHLGPHVILHIPGIPVFFGAYFLSFVFIFDEEQTSAAKKPIGKQESSTVKEDGARPTREEKGKSIKGINDSTASTS